MERTSKNRSWVVHLLFISGVAVLLLRTVAAFVEGALVALPTGRATASPPRPMEVMATLDLNALARATGLPVPAAALKSPEPVTELDAPPVRSRLRVRLLGTLVNQGNPAWSICSIQDLVTLKTVTFMQGDLVQGAEVVEIERQRVILKHHDRLEFIDGTPGASDSVAPSAAPGQRIVQLTENTYEIPRAELDRNLANLAEVSTHARVVPAFKDGRAQGFKFFSIRPGSIYSQIGLQNGDVLKRINGFELNSPEKLLELYAKLREASRIDLELERNGVAQRKTYTVR